MTAQADRWTRLWPVILWLLAWTHRAFLQLGSVDRAWPFPIFYEGDAETFFHYALAILEGSVYDGGIPFHPPLFPHFLSVLHALLGPPAPNLALRLLLAGVHSLSVPLLWVLLRRFLTPGAALWGALLAVWSFGLSVLAIAAVSEGIYLVLLLLALLLFRDLSSPGGRGASPQRSTRPTGREEGAVRGTSGRHGLPRALGLGVVLGLLALTRAEGLGIGALLLLWGIARRRSPAWRSPRRVWLAAVAAFALTLAPWTIRNAITLSRLNQAEAHLGLEPLPTFVVTTAYGPLNFALANHPEATGYFTRSRLTSGLYAGVLDLRDPQHRHAFLHGYADGLRFLRAEPEAFRRLAGHKLALLARALHLGWTQWNLPGGLEGTRYPVDLFTPDSRAALVLHLALLLPALPLLVRGRGARNPADGRAYLTLVGGLVAFTIVLTIGFFGYARQGALLLPLLFGLEGVTVSVALACLTSRLPTGHARAPAPARGPAAIPRSVRPGPYLLFAILALVWLIELAGTFQNRNFIASGETQPGSNLLNRDSVMTLRRK